ncbi:hypothetical protein Kpol_1018p2 [Vanderwaltozyma polyspora DSM 70294]|uniref:Structural maintenance of chromosomes protein n=1 Tax=Vanderwaltozyma polyspora (strain ATCC 22028 / DSM 70294 / BCRC 21397 / CBS 2163 / NBRC 10782 / NRRL Y-8283 / UCD 57-17) TaxID=436907 RepID=A7TDK5_VANPO|nr:uncharacterized protein Kpol_1018p2 [Vanderwaltozyma polyspora DSM 70294]EDO19475.1 hypothetical protein Kpol_1018p2 [Vanderwaltozyma polyspora DSM 70294]
MYIHRIVIKGFKTYRNETVIDFFSPNYNIVIGSNGSGKSNFFAAIRFVLSDDYSNLKREERQGLIHQGSGSVMSASVEIVFRDPGHRMILPSGVVPRENDEIFIRRTVGLKKDDYQVNDRNVTKSDVVRMLESAGFSMSNPYNIVPQGRIIAVTNAKDKERLQLLEDVVGAKSFESKLRASLKKMDETEQKRKKISEEMSELNKKLGDMEEERKELEKFNALEGKRKVLQFTLYDREINDIINQIEGLDSEYNNILASSEEYLQQLNKRETVVEEMTTILQDIDASLKLKGTTELQQSKIKYQELSNGLVDSQVKMKEIKSQLDSQTEQSKIDEKNLKIIAEAIKEKQSELGKILPRYEQLNQDEAKYKNELFDLKQKQKELMLKRGSYARFKTKEERNEWIHSEIEDLQEELTNLETTKITLAERRNEIQEELKTYEEQIDELLDSVQGPGVSAELEDLKSEIESLKSSYADKFDERKELWRTEQKLQTVLENMADSVKRSERAVNESMSRSLANGIASVKEITEKLNLPDDAVFGTLGELIKVSEKYKRCAEVIGGNSLFNVVVDTEETATIIMNELYHMKGGRVTFMPLNRIHVDNNITYPPNEQASCTPLIKKIKYDVRYEKAVKHIFGRTIVVKDLLEGSKIAKKLKLNAVTLDGDRADKMGVLTGGYHDQHKKTRLDTLKELKVSRQQHIRTSKELEDVREKLQVLDSEIDKLNDSIRKATNNREAILTNIDSLNVKLNNLKNEKNLLEESSSSSENKLERTEAYYLTTQTKLEAFRQDLDLPFDSELSPKEKEELENITTYLTELTENFEVTVEALSGLTIQIDSLKAELNSKLIPQENELKSKLSKNHDTHFNELRGELKAIAIESQSLEDQVELARSELESLEKEISKLNDEKVNSRKMLEKANSQQRMILKKLDAYQLDAEKFMIRKVALSNRREELQIKMREIGLLPEEGSGNFENSTSSDLFQELNSVNEEMSSLTNVNKRASENFRKFNEKKIELNERAAELDDSKVSIQNLIEKLKQQKVTAVDSTFKKVSENFSTVFEKLVPRGTAKLIIHRQEENKTRSKDKNSTESIYSGISISVSFNSKKNEQLHVEQLSGGQKTVCAIALILAIQMVDPAPFYLFDEIDAALDKQYRAAVADVIKSLSGNAQFICTTFRTDMLQVADKFFRVKYENKISTVVEVERQEAINFIRGNNKIQEV